MLIRVVMKVMVSITDQGMALNWAMSIDLVTRLAMVAMEAMVLVTVQAIMASMVLVMADMVIATTIKSTLAIILVVIMVMVMVTATVSDTEATERRALKSRVMATISDTVIMAMV